MLTILKQASIASFFQVNSTQSGTEVCSSADSERLPISSSSEESEHSDTNSESDGGEVPESDVWKPNVVGDAEFLHPLTSTDQCSSECCDEGLSSTCLLYTSPSPRDATLSRMPSSA